MTFFHRFGPTSECEEAARNYIKLAEETGNEDVMVQIQVLNYRVLLDLENPLVHNQVWEQLLDCAKRHPECLTTIHYHAVVGYLSGIVASKGDSDLLRKIDKHWHEDMIEASNEAFSSIKYTPIMLGPLTDLLRLYETKEEFDRREKEFWELHQQVPIEDPTMFFTRINWLFAAGHFDASLQMIDHLMEHMMFYTGDFDKHILYARFIQVISRLHTSLLTNKVSDHLLECCVGIANVQEKGYGLSVRCADVLLLAGRKDLALSLFKTVERTPDTFSIRTAILTDTLAVLADYSQSHDPLRVVYDAFSKGRYEEFTHVASELLSKPILRITDPLILLSLLKLFQLHNNPKMFITALRTELHGAITSSMEFFSDPKRRLPLVMRNLLNVAGKFLDADEHQQWVQRTTELEREREKEVKEKAVSLGDDRPRIEMIGQIKFVRGDREEVPIQGARSGMLLATLITDQLMRTNLDPLEFRQMVSGEKDPERSRKIQKAALHRLRSLLGQELLMMKEKPMLRIDQVHVDLLEVDQVLEEATYVLKEGKLSQGTECLRRLFRVLRGGEVILPGLYGEQFENLRSQFEARLREIVLKISLLLMQENDYEVAEEMLQGGLLQMNQDEEIVELLCELYEKNGQSVEAERMRMRLEHVGL